MSDQIMRGNGGKSSDLSSNVRRFAATCRGFAAIPNSGNRNGESAAAKARAGWRFSVSVPVGESMGRTHDKEDTTRGRAPAHDTGTRKDARGLRTRSPAFARGARRGRGAGRRRHGGFRLVRYETGTVPERPSGVREPPGRGTVHLPGGARPPHRCRLLVRGHPPSGDRVIRVPSEGEIARRARSTVIGRRRVPVSVSLGEGRGGVSPCVGGLRTAIRPRRVNHWSVRARVSACRGLGHRVTRLGRGEEVPGETGETSASGVAEAPEVAVVGEVPGNEGVLGGVLSKTVPDESGARCRTGRGRMRGQHPWVRRDAEK